MPLQRHSSVSDTSLLHTRVRLPHRPIQFSIAVKMAARHSPRLIHRLAGRTFAAAMRLVPWKRRLAVAVALVRLYSRFDRGETGPRRYRIDGPLEARLIRMLDVLTRYGCTFAVNLDVDGQDHVERAIAGKGAILVLGPHAMLNFLVHRYLHDRGVNALIPATQTNLYVYGTKTPARTTRGGPGSLLRIWQELRRGGAVAALIDRRAGSGVALQVETAKGVVDVEESLFRLAERTGARVLFMSAHVTDRGTVCARFDSPESRADVLRDRFVTFMRAHIAVTAAEGALT